MTVRNAPRLTSAARRFRPQVEWLEQRDCPTNVAPSLVVNMEVVNDSEVRFYGQVTDESPTTTMVYIDGQALGMAQPNSNGEFSITLTPMGLGNVSVYAADEEWLMSANSNFNFQNSPPVIEGFFAEFLGGTTWKISGRVVDGAPGGLTVTFGDVLFNTGYYSIDTQADGTFEFCAEIPEAEEGIASAQVTDQWGLTSALVQTLIEYSA